MLAWLNCPFSVTSPSPETFSDVRCSPCVQPCSIAQHVCYCSMRMKWTFCE